MPICQKHGTEKAEKTRTRDGRLVTHYVCLECARANVRAHFARRGRSEPKHQKSARRKVRKAIQRGKLLKKPCERCGDVNAQAHHEDYSKPLDVIWLCPFHHMEAHGRLAVQNKTLGNKTPAKPSPLVKLTVTQALEIRALKGTMRNIDIARKYGISDGHVANIFRGTKWKTVSTAKAG